MTIAPRIEVFTQLSCNRLHGHDRYNHTQSLIYDPTVAAQGATSFYLSLDPLGPPLHPHHANRTPYYNLTFANNGSDDEEEDPRRLPSSRCLSDPAVQAGAARIQTIMTTTMGLLSALTTGWWGRFGERHGRTKVLAISTLGLFLTYVSSWNDLVLRTKQLSFHFQRLNIHPSIYAFFSPVIARAQAPRPRTHNRRPPWWLVNPSVCHVGLPERLHVERFTRSHILPLRRRLLLWFQCWARSRRISHHASHLHAGGSRRRSDGDCRFLGRCFLFVCEFHVGAVRVPGVAG